MGVHLLNVGLDLLLGGCGQLHVLLVPNLQDLVVLSHAVDSGP